MEKRPDEDWEGGEAVTTAPSIHRNGSSRLYLEETYFAARIAVGEAIMALQATAPNSRDYYVTGEHSYTAARNEHLERIRKLEAVAAELRDIWSQVATRTGGER